MNFYTYVDQTSEPEPRVFYVGKGNDARVADLVRNVHHARVVARHGIVREVVLVTSVEEAAFAEEVRLVAEHHTFFDDPCYGGIGCNMTPGGEGHVPSAATRRIYSRRMKAHWADPVKRAAMVASMVGKNVGKRRTLDWRRAHAAAMRGANNPNHGRPMPEPRKERLRAAKRGVPSPLKGSTVAREAVAKRMKPIDVTGADGTIRSFLSRKEAATTLAQELGVSPHTVLCRFVARHVSYKGLGFTYR